MLTENYYFDLLRLDIVEINFYSNKIFIFHLFVKYKCYLNVNIFQTFNTNYFLYI